MSWPVVLAVSVGFLLGLCTAWVLSRMLSSREARLQASVQALASSALRDNAQMFLTLAREAFGREQASMEGNWRQREQALRALVDPIRSALQKTEAQVESLERERRDAFATLRTQIEALAQ